MAKSDRRPRWLRPDGAVDRRRWDHVRIDVQVIEDPRLGAHAIAVYLGLVKHAESLGGQTFVGQAKLMQYTQLSESSVRRALRVLKECRYIEIEEQKGRSSLYRVLQPPPLSQRQGSVSDTPVTGNDPPLSGQSLTPVTGTDEGEGINDNHLTTPYAAPSSLGPESGDLGSLTTFEETLAMACGMDPAEITRSAKTELARAAKELVGVGATAEALTARSNEYRRRWPKAKLTPKAMAKHWPTLVSDEAGSWTQGFKSMRITEVV